MISRNRKRSTTLIQAIDENNTSKLEKCISYKGFNVDTKINIDYGPATTPLCRAALNGYTEIVKSLLQTGADVDGKDEKGVVPLQFAIQLKHLEVVKLLLHANAKTDFQATTALHLASKHDDLRIMKLLLEKVNIDKKDVDGQTALHVSVFNGNVDAIKEILKHHANVNLTDNNGNTVLHINSMERDVPFGKCVEIVRILLKHGVNTKIINNDGLLAEEIENGKLCDIILQHTEKSLPKRKIYGIKNLVANKVAMEETKLLDMNGKIQEYENEIRITKQNINRENLKIKELEQKVRLSIQERRKCQDRLSDIDEEDNGTFINLFVRRTRNPLRSLLRTLPCMV